MKKLLAALALLSTAILAQGQWVLIEDFEDVSDWTQNGSSASLTSTTGIAGGLGAVGALSHSTINVSTNYLSLGANSIAEGTMGTIHFKLMIPEFASDSDVSHFFGLTDSDAPGAFGDFRGYIGTPEADNSGSPYPITARDGGTNSSILSATEGTWYNVWMVFDNIAGGTDSYDVYINTGTAHATMTDLVAENFTLRNGDVSTALDTLSFVGATNQGAVAAGRPVYFDQVFVDISGENLTYVIPEPSTYALMGAALLLLALVARRRR